MSTNTGARGQFEVPDINAPRFVFSAAAHQMYGERCEYFLLRLREPSRNSLESVADLVAQAQIQSACIYLLLGYHDVLVRVWVTERKRARLIELLADQEIIAEVLEFFVGEIDFLWQSESSELPEAPTPSRRRELVADLSRAVLVGLPSPRAVTAELRRCGLLLRVPKQPDGSVKFYTALSRVPGTLRARDEFARLRDLLLKHQGKDFHNASLYTGVGFAEYLVKLVVRDFYDIGKATKVLDEVLPDLQLRPMTLLIFNKDAPELDVVDVDWNDWSGPLADLQEVLDELDPTAGALIGRLDPGQRADLSEVLTKYMPLFEADIAPTLHGVVLAFLERDNVLLAEKLTFLLHLENLLRGIVVPTLLSGSPWGDKWRDRVLDLSAADADSAANKKATPPLPRDPRDWTLGNLERVVRLCISEPQIGERIRAALGDHAVKKLASATKIRNDLAHGRFYDVEFVSSKVWPNWIKVIEEVFDAAEVYSQILGSAGDSTSKDDDGTTPRQKRRTG